MGLHINIDIGYSLYQCFPTCLNTRRITSSIKSNDTVKQIRQWATNH